MLLATARVTGQALSGSVAGAIVTSLRGAAAGSTLIADRALKTLVGTQERELDAPFVHALRDACLLCAVFAAVGALLTLARSRREQRA